MATVDKAEKISITLPPDMLMSIKQQVQSGSYGSTSEVIREAMRLWQRKQEEHQTRLEAVRLRLEKSANSGDPIPIGEAFDRIRRMHEERMKQDGNEEI